MESVTSRRAIARGGKRISITFAAGHRALLRNVTHAVMIENQYRILMRRRPRWTYSFILTLVVNSVISLGAGAQSSASPPHKSELPAGHNILVDAFDSVSDWHTNPAKGVEISIHPDSGRNGRGMRVDFDFHGNSGYGIVNRRVNLDLPANYQFAFGIRGNAPMNTLEFKLVDPTGGNVWWSNNPRFVFSPEWRSITRRKREICFAWGPQNGGEIHRLAAIEFAITAGTGGKGSFWIDDLTLTSLDPDSPFDVTTPVASLPIVGTWESTVLADGQLGPTLNFASDGSLTATYGAMQPFRYSVADNRLTTTFTDPHTGKTSANVIAIRIQHDTLFQKDGNGPGRDAALKRLRPAKDGDDPIFGVWTFSDDTQATGFVDFGRNGRGAFGLPLNSCSGVWTNSGDGSVSVSINGQPAQRWNYSVENNFLTMRHGDGTEIMYNRLIPPQ